MNRTASYLPLFIMILINSLTTEETVYEPFDYAAGAINGTQSGGIGMSGSWSTSVTNSGTLYSMISGGLSFTDLTTSGSVKAKRNTAPGGAEMNRAISAASQTALTVDGTTIWFSILINTQRFSAGNENGTFVFGSAGLDSNDVDRVLPSITGGEGFGVHVNGNNAGGNPFYIHAYSIDGGASSKSVSFLDTGTTSGTYLIAGKISWVANGGNDSLWVFNITDPSASEPAEGDAVATITADLDQSVFDTLAIANRQVSNVDEIRLAPTYYEVMGREPPRIATGTLLRIE